MNRIVNVVLVSIVLAAMVFIACERKKTPENASAASTQEYSYMVSACKRNVSWSATDEQWQTIQQGQTIQKGSWIETGRASAATLTGSLGDVVMLGEQAKIQLLVETLKTGSNGVDRGVALVKGMAQFAVAKGRGGFIVETPSAHIKVKGTKFTVSYDSAHGITDVRVQEGIVDVQDSKTPEKTYTITANRALIGIGEPTPVEREITRSDSSVLKEFEQTEAVPDAEPAREASESPAVDKEKIKEHLNQESNAITGQQTQAERIRAQNALDNERNRSQHAMDSIRAGYHQAAKTERDTFAAHKETAAKRLDSTRSAGQAALDAERAKYNKAANKTPGAGSSASDDAFDELHKRKSGQ